MAVPLQASEAITEDDVREAVAALVDVCRGSIEGADSRVHAAETILQYGVIHPAYTQQVAVGVEPEEG